MLPAYKIFVCYYYHHHLHKHHGAINHCANFNHQPPTTTTTNQSQSNNQYKNICENNNSNQELNDVDQIYRVLKQAGELSGDKTNALASGSGFNDGLIEKLSTATGSAHLPEIPIVSEPEYPERSVPTAASGIGGQPFPRSYGTIERSKLAVAPLLDVSSTSGADDGLFSVSHFSLSQSASFPFFISCVLSIFIKLYTLLILPPSSPMLPQSEYLIHLLLTFFFFLFVHTIFNCIYHPFLPYLTCTQESNLLALFVPLPYRYSLFNGTLLFFRSHLFLLQSESTRPNQLFFVACQIYFRLNECYARLWMLFLYVIYFKCFIWHDDNRQNNLAYIQ